MLNRLLYLEEMFEEIATKQALAVDFFRKSLEKKQLSRAYLLTGSANADKLSLIKELNQILNCERNSESFSENPVEEVSLFSALSPEAIGTATLDKGYKPACNECKNCRWIDTDEHPRTPLFLEAEVGHRKAGIIPVPLARLLQQELIQNSEYYRVIIIKDASSKILHKETANCLLKTIEEAKSRTVFMLLSDFKDTVLPTIASRCQTINFNSNEEKEFSESSQVLLEEFKNSINTGRFSSRLEQLIEAESLAKHEDSELIEMLSLMQNEISERLAADYDKQSDLVLSLEAAIDDLKRFIRPKAVLAALLKEF